MWSIRKESKTSSYNNTDPLFKHEELLNLSNLIILNKLKFYYNYSDMLLPEYFSDFNITNQGANHTQFNGRTIEFWEWISNFIPHFIGHTRIEFKLC